MPVALENRLTMLSMDPLATTEEESALAASDYANLTAHLTTDTAGTMAGQRAVVVGGGVIGLMTALYLTRAGAQIELFEAQSLGAAASGRNAGGIYAFGRAIGEVALARSSMDLWEDLSAGGIDSHFQRPGHAMIALNDHERSLLDMAERHYALAGLPTRMLSPEEAVTMLPGVAPDNAGALMGTTDGQGYPFTAVSSIIAELRAAGAVIHDHCPVQSVIERGGQARGVRSELQRISRLQPCGASPALADHGDRAHRGHGELSVRLRKPCLRAPHPRRKHHDRRWWPLGTGRLQRHELL
jgi:sarcosine oxidase subunit beta